MENIKLVGDDLYLSGQLVGHITLPSGTLRDRVEESLHIKEAYSSGFEDGVNDQRKTQEANGQ